MKALITISLVLLLSACEVPGFSSNGTSDLPNQVHEARDLIRPYYPKAAELPIKVGSKDRYTYKHGVRVKYYAAYFRGGIAVVYPFWFELWNKDPIDAACTLVHEWKHHKQIHTEEDTLWRDIAEEEADILEQECITKIRRATG